MKKRSIKISVKKNHAFIIVGLLVAIPALVGGIALTTGSLTKPVASPAPPPIPKEVTTLIDTVGKKTFLPPDETPTVATVTNASQLQDQAFFAKARNGDKVLIYLNAKRAILYRPTTGEVVESAPLEVETPSASDSAEASQSATLDTSATSQTASGAVILKVRL